MQYKNMQEDMERRFSDLNRTLHSLELENRELKKENALYKQAIDKMDDLEIRKKVALFIYNEDRVVPRV